jgi:hypothetical protein
MLIKRGIPKYEQHDDSPYQVVHAINLEQEDQLFDI